MDDLDLDDFDDDIEQEIITIKNKKVIIIFYYNYWYIYYISKFIDNPSLLACETLAEIPKQLVLNLIINRIIYILN